MTGRPVVLLLWLSAALIVGAQRRQTTVDYPPVLPTLVQTLRFVDAAVYLEIGDYVLSTPDGTLVQRLYSCRVIDVIADPAGLIAKREQLTLAVPGGFMVVDGRHLHTANALPAFNRGIRRIVFLKSLPEAGQFGIAFGAAGVFGVEGDRVEVPEQARRMSELRDGGSPSYAAFKSLVQRSIRPRHSGSS